MPPCASARATSRRRHRCPASPSSTPPRRPCPRRGNASADSSSASGRSAPTRPISCARRWRACGWPSRPSSCSPAPTRPSRCGTRSTTSTASSPRSPTSWRSRATRHRTADRSISAVLSMPSTRRGGAGSRHSVVPSEQRRHHHPVGPGVGHRPVDRDRRPGGERHPPRAGHGRRSTPARLGAAAPSITVADEGHLHGDPDGDLRAALDAGRRPRHRPGPRPIAGACRRRPPPTDPRPTRRRSRSSSPPP